MFKIKYVILLLLITAFLASCAKPSIYKKGPKGTLTGTIYFNDNKKGTLYLLLFSRSGEHGAPINYRQLKKPVFPYKYSFENLTPGQYNMTVYFDVNSDSPPARGQKPRPNDAVGQPPEPVYITQGEGAEGVDVTLNYYSFMASPETPKK